MCRSSVRGLAQKEHDSTVSRLTDGFSSGWIGWVMGWPLCTEETRLGVQARPGFATAPRETGVEEKGKSTPAALGAYSVTGRWLVSTGELGEERKP